MVREVRIYIEGGGDRSHQKASMREGFSAFFAELKERARGQRIRWNLVMCDSRRNAYEDFQTARATHLDAFIVLLVDSESPVSTSPWVHLMNQDDWQANGANEDQCHLMVQTMEAWLIADVDELARFYGQGFLRSQIPDREDVEQIPKADLVRVLTEASRRTQKCEYAKIRHAAVLLKRIDPSVVRAKAKHCERLFHTLEEKLGENAATE